MRHLPLLLAASLAIVVGTITDKTTGQPLVGVSVTVAGSTPTVHAQTDSRGRFELQNIAEGTYTLHLSSRDVPSQTVHIRVSGKSTHVTLHACSTTLDYSCGNPNAPGGS